jgi:hypothetical protein
MSEQARSYAKIRIILADTHEGGHKTRPYNPPFPSISSIQATPIHRRFKYANRCSSGRRSMA